MASDLSIFSLTEEQEKVARHDGNACVLACPGAGKTRTMIARGAVALEHLGPRQGLALLSFSNAAADAYRGRIVEFGLQEILHPPHFVGTFDSFVLRYLVGPGGSPWSPESALRVRDSWDGMEVTVPTGKLGRGGWLPVPLGAFPLNRDGRVRIDPQGARGVPATYSVLSRISQDPNLRTKAEAAAQRKLEALLTGGWITPHEARMVALNLLSDGSRAAGPLSVISGRFRVVIADEAQDCDKETFDIVRALERAGSTCIVVADPEQCIYRWRGVDPSHLQDLAREFGHHTITGNFRSSPAICQIAASVRAISQTDESVGETQTEATPIYVYAYKKNQTGEMRNAFLHLLKDKAREVQEAVVLCHHRDTARRVAGGGGQTDHSTLKSVRLMLAVSHIRASSRTDLDAVKEAKKLVEQVMISRLEPAIGHLEDLEPRTRAWIRRRAQMLVPQLVSIEEQGSDWLDAARATLDVAPPPGGLRNGKTIKQVFRAPSKDKAAPHVEAFGGNQALRWSSIHQAKGHEFESVLLVLQAGKRCEELLDSWDTREVDGSGGEARSVLYVGITRASRLLCLGVPEKHLDRVRLLAARDGASVELLAC